MHCILRKGLVGCLFKIPISLSEISIKKIAKALNKGFQKGK